MTAADGAAGARMALLVLYAGRLEETRRFYAGLGLSFVEEQHGAGPVHHAATLADGTVIELYPATGRRPASTARLGLHVTGWALVPPVPPGRHVREDPDGRVVELYAV